MKNIIDWKNTELDGLPDREVGLLVIGDGFNSYALGKLSKDGFFTVQPFCGEVLYMNDVTSAIGLVQLKKLQYYVDRRKKIWDKYNERLSEIDELLLPPPIPNHIKSSYYLYWIQTPKRDKLAQYLKDNGIYTTFRYYPLHLAWRHKLVKLPNSENINATTLNLPLHCGLSDEQVDYICDKVKQFYD